MSDKLINPAGIHQFTGNLAQLDRDTAALTGQAGHFRTAGAGVHNTFQGLSAFYHAPEADQLFATTAPVALKTDAFADDLEKVSAALSAYSTEVRPLVDRLDAVTADAHTFVSQVQDDDKWREDEDKVQHNNDLVYDVNAIMDAFWAAERSCCGKITALVGGAPLIVDDGTHKQNMYGYKAEDLDHAEETPWGSTTEQEYSGLAWAAHQAKSYVWDGFIIDGVVGTIRGLGTLFVADGWDAAGQAWTNLAKLSTALTITTIPGLSTIFLAAPDKALPSWIRDSRTALKETGKALIAYDEWGKNPARAAGAVTFNVITTVLTDGAGTAAKTGAAARTISLVGKFGRVVDPMTYVFKAGRVAFVKVGDLMANLKNLRTGTIVDVAGGAYKLPGLTDVAPARPPVLPETSVRLIDPEGKTVYLDPKTGALLDESGKVVQTVGDIKVEPSAAERAGAEHNPLPQREPVLVGAHPTAHVGDGIGTRGHVPGGIAHDLRQRPSASHAGSSGGRGADTLPSGARDGVDQTGHASGSGHGTGDEGSGGGHVPGQHGGSGSGSSHEGRPPHGQEPPPSPLEIMRHQVVRANNDPAWFKKYYRSNGYRRFTKLDGGYGQRLPKLAADPTHPGKWVAASDLPPAVAEKYLRPDPVLGHRTAVSDDALKHLDSEATKRHQAIAADRAAEKRLAAAEKAYEANPTQELADAMAHSDATHSPLHGQMSRASEMFGENVAEHHAIPENYPHAERLDDGALGNNRFDQVYRTADGRYVVVEAKGSEKAQLGTRKGHTGQRVTQGTPEYFETILNEMDKRADKAKRTPEGRAEKALAKQLRVALKNGNVDYVLVKAKPDGARYAGYQMKQFDISP
ncbi:hypothetical protein QMK19_25865 [Streptomyces sp. H10-C2]|uniref:hypothetical protein n=1 Tax=unclassified Streptomyces TaxID=2593676 RepID=UPI0024BB3FDA|nr:MULTISPECIES: hypothetical protein [unclassified Streptomyces]MDJ0345624.1 hypothetical protein [Streptomyces sp. PH10-H1]MDJ0372989.1 hypothetical protein [Streptomyces sp. H10-C2]